MNIRLWHYFNLKLYIEKLSLIVVIENYKDLHACTQIQPNAPD